MDIEAITHDGVYYYVIGSHGVKKKKCTMSQSRHIVRIKIDPKTKLNDGAPEVSSLEGVFKQDPLLAKFMDDGSQTVCLQNNGLNIEGLAARDGRLFVGFRAPSLKNSELPVVSVDAEGVFAPLPASSSNDRQTIELGDLPSGDQRGVRDIIAFERGFLMIVGASGPDHTNEWGKGVDDENFELVYWDG